MVSGWDLPDSSPNFNPPDTNGRVRRDTVRPVELMRVSLFSIKRRVHSFTGRPLGTRFFNRSAELAHRTMTATMCRVRHPGWALDPFTVRCWERAPSFHISA
jgi:hypothetical protein